MLAQDITLKEVKYYPPSTTGGWVTIISDEYTGPISPSTSVIGWQNLPIPLLLSKPVAYISGYKARIGAKFSCVGEVCPGFPLHVRAEAQVDGVTYKLPSKPVTSPDYGYPVSEVDKEFPQYVVRYYPEFTWNWYSTLTPNIESSWQPIGSRSNLLMVVHKQPYSRNITGDLEPATTYYFSSIAIGCKAAAGKGAIGTADNPDAVVEAIFAPFRNRCVSKVNSTTCMTYWNNYSVACTDIHGLLNTGDGTCGAWALFFQDMLKLQGITTGKLKLVTYQELNENIVKDEGLLNTMTAEKLENASQAFFGTDYTNVTWEGYTNGTNDIYSAYFYVKEHDFAPLSGSNQNFYLYRAEPRPAIPPNLPDQITTQSNKILKESARTGIAGQGNTDPRSVFNNHTVFSYKEKSGSEVYMDPSYGTPDTGYYTDRNLYETASFSGFGAFGRYMTATGTNFVIWINELNDGTFQLKIAP